MTRFSSRPTPSIPPARSSSSPETAAQRRTPQLGIHDLLRVELLGGLAEGDQVIVGGGVAPRRGPRARHGPVVEPHGAAAFGRARRDVFEGRARTAPDHGFHRPATALGAKAPQRDRGGRGDARRARAHRDERDREGVRGQVHRDDPQDQPARHPLRHRAPPRRALPPALHGDLRRRPRRAREPERAPVADQAPVRDRPRAPRRAGGRSRGAVARRDGAPRFRREDQIGRSPRDSTSRPRTRSRRSISTSRRDASRISTRPATGSSSARGSPATSACTSATRSMPPPPAANHAI